MPGFDSTFALSIFSCAPPSTSDPEIHRDPATSPLDLDATQGSAAPGTSAWERWKETGSLPTGAGPGQEASHARCELDLSPLWSFRLEGLPERPTWTNCLDERWGMHGLPALQSCGATFGDGFSSPRLAVEARAEMASADGAPECTVLAPFVDNAFPLGREVVGERGVPEAEARPPVLGALLCRLEKESAGGVGPGSPPRANGLLAQVIMNSRVALRQHLEPIVCSLRLLLRRLGCTIEMLHIGIDNQAIFHGGSRALPSAVASAGRREGRNERETIETRFKQERQKFKEG